MLSLHDIVTRTTPPPPWTEGDNIPWDDPEFSERMLAEHLTQDHDLASRRSDLIDTQVAAIASAISDPPARILDLACGPGLYLNRLVERGYGGVGLDFSPASIRHAQRTAGGAEYKLADLRKVDFGYGFDAALLLYGQINVFRRGEARDILTKAHMAMRSGGTLVLEPQTDAQIRTAAQAPPTWSSHENGLFSDRPHLLLTESFWDESTRTSTQRFYVVDIETHDVTCHAMSNAAYTEQELADLLRGIGFVDVETKQSLSGDPADDGLFAVFART